MVIEISILGSAGAIPNHERDNTYLAIKSSGISALIDCAGSPLQKMQQIGIDPYELDFVVFTHRHPDHIYGIPSLLQGIGLLKRKKSLTIFGSRDVLDLIACLIKVFELEELLGPLVTMCEISQDQNQVLLENGDFTMWTTPVKHGEIPAIAIRIQNKITKKTLVYSGDTRPCENMVQFSKNANILIHECSLPAKIESNGHSNTKQVGELARVSDVEHLILVHLPAFENDLNKMLEEVRLEFKGKVDLPKHLACYTF